MSYETEPAEKNLDKIRITPVHKFESIQNWWPWLVIVLLGLPLSLCSVPLIGELFGQNQEGTLNKTDIIVMSAFTALGIFINLLLFNFMKKTKQIGLLFKNRAFDGIEFSNKGICFDIKAIDSFTQNWMIKNQQSHYALEWADVKKVEFVPARRKGNTIVPAALKIKLNNRQSASADDLKTSLQKYENNIWIAREHLVGYEKSIVKLLNNHTKVEIDHQDVLK